MSENDFELTTEHMEDITGVMCVNTIPETSKKKYTGVYEQFVTWSKKNEKDTFSEKALLNYFIELSKKFKVSTLWTQYSMLRTMFSVNQNIDISRYANLRGFIKRQAYGYRPKKSNVFTSEQMNRFLSEAPDYEYLLMKVVLIMGVVGACARDELHNMKISDITDFGSAALVQIPKNRSKSGRKFMITGSFYNIFKKYTLLRPVNFNDQTFFVNYHKGKCFIQRVGINKLGRMGKSIATYLNLSNPELYTGHCFRRSANILVDFLGNGNSLKKNKGWRYSADTEKYIDQTLKKQFNVENTNSTNLLDNVTEKDIPSTSSTVEQQQTKEIKEEYDEEMIKNDDSSQLTKIDNFSEECNLPTIKLEKEDRNNPEIEVTNGNIAEVENDNDHFSIFGKYVASRLRRLNNSRLQAICQQRINQLIFDFEMKHESDN